MKIRNFIDEGKDEGEVIAEFGQGNLGNLHRPVF
jgi:hypothetical protein